MQIPLNPRWLYTCSVIHTWMGSVFSFCPWRGLTVLALLSCSRKQRCLLSDRTLGKWCIRFKPYLSITQYHNCNPRAHKALRSAHHGRNLLVDCERSLRACCSRWGQGLLLEWINLQLLPRAWWGRPRPPRPSGGESLRSYIGTVSSYAAPV